MNEGLSFPDNILKLFGFRKTAMETFTDKRGREWEIFTDRSYYGMTCVMPVGETDYRSELAFHFETWKEGQAFARTVAVSR